MTTMPELTGRPGFTLPSAEQMPTRRHAVALEVIATGALTLSLIVAATVVSMGDKLLASGPAAEPIVLQTQLPPLLPH
jgi:hypothetical protein